MIDLSYMIWDMKTEERRNRFTGEREFLTKEEADIHDSVFYHCGKFSPVTAVIERQGEINNPPGGFFR